MSSASAVSGASALRLMTFNLCNTPQMDKDKAYEGLRFADRLGKIVAVIKALSPDIIGFQEVRDYSDGTVMADLWDGLGPLGYRIQSQESSPHELAVYNAIAYKAAKVWPQTVISWYNSNTPDEVSCSYGNGWPRAVLTVEFYPVKQITVCRQKQGSDESVSFTRPSPDYASIPVLVVNSHLGLGRLTSDPKEKVFSNQNTVEKIKQFVGSKQILVVPLGDYNSFVDGEFYEEEMNVYKSNGYIDAVTASPLENQDGIAISGTFIGYTPDTFKCPNDSFSSSLQHIWYKAFNFDEGSSFSIKKCFASTLTGDAEFDSRQTTQESDLLTGVDGFTLRDKYPSDHLPTILDLELTSNLNSRENYT